VSHENVVDMAAVKEELSSKDALDDEATDFVVTVVFITVHASHHCIDRGDRHDDVPQLAAFTDRATAWRLLNDGSRKCAL